MRVISILNSKGGAGKTTLSIHLAKALADRGDRVLLVDTDIQQSARQWAEENGSQFFTTIGLEQATLDKEIEKLKQSYDWVVIDGAAKADKIIVGSIKASDLIIIPVRPSAFDVWALSALVDMIIARQTLTDGRPYAVFQPQAIKKGTRLAGAINKALEELELPSLDGVIVDRTSIPTALAEGKTVFETDDEKAKLEMNRMVKQVVKLFEDFK